MKSRLTFSLFALSVIVFSVHTASAASRVSELIWQPPKGIFAVTPTFTYQSLDIKDSDELRTGRGKGSALEIQYGLLSVVSLGAKISYKRLDERVNDLSLLSETTVEGFEDNKLFTRIIWPLTRTRLHFGVDYLMSNGSKNFDSGALRGNVSSGGNSLRPYFSFQFPLGPFWIGFFGQWRLFEQRNVKSAGILTQQITGGDELDVYANFEVNSGQTAFGLGAGTFLKQQETTTTLSTSTSETSQSFEKIHVLTYFKMNVMRWMAFTLRVDYFDTIDQDLGSGVTRESGKELSGEAGLRFMF